MATPGVTLLCTSADDVIGPDSGVAIEASDEPIDESELEPSVYESARSVAASSSIYDHEIRHGRTYHHFRNGRYPFPNDEDEQSRDDLKHALVMEIMDCKLYLSPIGASPQKILDVGTGTGTWAIAVSDEIPSAAVTGVDLSPIQPVWVPPNCKFVVDDIEDDLWMHGDNFDLIFFRGMAACLSDIPKTVRHAFEQLRPGGWTEWQDWSAQMYCDDGTMPNDSYTSRFYPTFHEAFKKFNLDILAPHRMRSVLEGTGFINISCKVYNVPLGRWPKDPTLRLVGMYYQLIMEAMVPALAAKPFHALGWSEEEIAVFSAKCLESFRDSQQHAYTKWLVWIAQKPEEPSAEERHE